MPLARQSRRDDLETEATDGAQVAPLAPRHCAGTGFTLFSEPLSVCLQNQGFEQKETKETKNLGRPASIAGNVPYFHFHISNFCFLLYPHAPGNSENI